MLGTWRTSISRWVLCLLALVTAATNASVVYGDSSPVDCSSYVLISIANAKSTADSRTRTTTSTADVTIKNTSALNQSLSAPIHAVISINNATGTVTMPEAQGGPNTSPYGKYYYDLSVPNGMLSPGEQITFSVKFVRSSTVRFTYSITTFAVLASSNQPPVANAGSSRTIAIPYGQASITATLDGSASTDPDGTIAAYSWTGTIDPDDVAAPSVKFEETGNYEFSLRVTDNSGAVSTASNVVITVVKEAVHQPVLSLSPPPYQITAGSTDPLNINVAATSPDGRIVSLSASPQMANAVFSASKGVNASGTFAFKPDYSQSGIYLVAITARDSYGITSSATVQITVTAANRAPVLTVQETAVVSEGDILKIPVNATDPDGDLLTLAAAGLPANSIYMPSAGAITFAAMPGQANGSPYNVAVTASDGQTSVTRQVAITVTEASGSGQSGALTLELDPIESPTFLSTQRITGTVNGASQTQVVQKSALITEMVPTTGKQGEILTVSLTGGAANYVTHFLAGRSTASFGNGITVKSLSIASPTHATAVIHIDRSAVVGTRSVSIATGSETAVSLSAFNIIRGLTTVAGRVLDPDTGQPIGNATVIIQGTTVYALTDSNGYYTLENVPSGQQTLVVNAPNHEVLTLSLQAEANTAIQVDVLKPASTVFDATASASSSVMNVIGRGATELSAATKDSGDVKKLVIDSILMTGGKSAGVLDEFGNQINPNIEGHGTISLKASGVDLIAERWQRGETMTLGDFLIGFPLFLEWPVQPTPLRVLSALQAVVDRAWDNPRDEKSALLVALFNRGTSILPTPPRLSLETPLNALQSYLIASTLFAWATNDMRNANAGGPVLPGEGTMAGLRKEILLAYKDSIVIGDSVTDGGRPIFYAQATTEKPVAFAGPDKTVFLKEEDKTTEVEITLDGSGSYPKAMGASIVRYQWRPHLSTDPTPADEANPTVKIKSGAHHTYRLWVTDSNGKQSDPSDVTIDITGDCNFATNSDPTTFPWCATFRNFAVGKGVKKIDLVAQYVDDIVSTIQASKVISPMISGKPTYMEAMTDGVIGFFEGKNSALVMKLNALATPDPKNPDKASPLKEIYENATAGAKQMGALSEFVTKSADLLKDQLDSFVGEVANQMFDYIIKKFVGAIIESTRPPVPFIRSAEVLPPDPATGRITQQVKIVFTPTPDELSDIRKATAGTLNGIRKYSYLIYRLSTSNGQGLQRITIIPGYSLPYDSGDSNASMNAEGNYVWYDTNPPVGSNHYYVVARVVRSKQVPNSTYSYDGRLILDYIMGLAPGGSTISNAAFKSMDAMETILRGMIYQDSDLSDPARLYVGAPTQNTHPTLDLAVDKILGRTYLSVPDTSGIFTVTPTGIELFADAGFKKPFQRGLAVDRQSNVYSENKASDDQFGGRIFSYAPSDGRRSLVGSTNYYSLDIQYARATDVQALAYGIDKNGQCLYIADAVDQTIKRLSLFGPNPPAHNVGQPYAASSLFLFQPETKMATDCFGHLYITQGPDLLKVAPVPSGGTHVSSVFPSGNSPFSWLSGIDFDAFGNAYVADFQAGTITMIPGAIDTFTGQDASYKKRLVVMSGLTYPIDVKVTDNGRGFITVDAEGIHKKYFGIAGRVWDKANNMPLGGANLMVDNAIEPAKTDAEGYFSIADVSLPQGPQTVKIKITAPDGRTQVIPNILLNGFGHTPLFSDLVFDPPEMPTLDPIPTDDADLIIDPDPLPLETPAADVSAAELGITAVRHFIAPDRRIYSSKDTPPPLPPAGSTTDTISFTPQPPEQPEMTDVIVKPVVSIITPSDEMVTTAGSITVTGLVVPSENLTSVTLIVNGEEQDIGLTNGQFSATVALRDGVTVISARAGSTFVDHANKISYQQGQSAAVHVHKGADLPPSIDYAGMIFKADGTSYTPYPGMTVTLYCFVDGAFRIIDSMSSGPDGLYRFHLANSISSSSVIRAVFDRIKTGNAVPMKIVISDPRS